MKIDMRPIPGYEGVYSASSDGRIWSHPREWVGHQGSRRSHAGKWLKGNVVKGYAYVPLFCGGKRKTVLVSRAVAMAFIQNHENKPQVNHRDGDKLNNAASNLEWVTGSENIRHSYANGMHDNARKVAAKNLPRSRSVVYDSPKFKAAARINIQKAIAAKREKRALALCAAIAGVKPEDVE